MDRAAIAGKGEQWVLLEQVCMHLRRPVRDIDEEPKGNLKQREVLPGLDDMEEDRYLTKVNRGKTKVDRRGDCDVEELLSTFNKERMAGHEH